MNGKRIINRLVESMQPGPKDSFLWDSDLRGFGLKVTKGGNKVYLVQYRMGGRASAAKRITIGKHGSPWQSNTARAEAQRILLAVKSGIDPREQAIEEQRQRSELPFHSYAEKFLTLYAAKEWRPRTLSTHASNLKRWIIPVLGAKALPTIVRRDITEVLDRLPANSPALPRDIFVLMRRVFSWAVQRGDIEKSPMDGMRVPKSVPSRHHILTDSEMIYVAAHSQALGPIWGAFIRMLILTGQRRDEVAKMDWSELELEGGKPLWTIPSDRTKNGREHRVPLSEAALHELRDIADGEWLSAGPVFSHKPGTAISGYSRTKRRLDAIIAAENICINDWRLHDLRRTFATSLQRLGVRFEVIEALLNHVSLTQAGVVGVYQRYDWGVEKRQAMDLWSNHLNEELEKLRRAS